VLEAQGIRKSYGGVTALAGVDFHARAGSVHALLGENGAGKSTLVKVLVGAVQPDAGVLRLAGEERWFGSTADAAAHGVAVVSQELSLFPDLEVLANLFPYRGPRIGPFVDRRRWAELARPVLEQLELDVPLTRRLEELPLAQRQLVEIARALITNPRVLILDEPTSALQAHEVDRLTTTLERLRELGVAVVYVSHILEEVMSLSDEVTVLRDGRTVLDSVPRNELTMKDVVHAMIGEEKAVLLEQQSAMPRRERADGGDVALRFEDVSVAGALGGVDLELRAGEIVGLAGVAGAGHLTVLDVAFGLKRTTDGAVTLHDGRHAPHTLREALGRGVAYVTGDRKRTGLMLDKPIWENVVQITAVGLGREGRLLRPRRLRRRAKTQVDRVGTRCRSVEQLTELLSGGNQQKVVFAKGLEAAPRLLLLDDPTRGVDVGSKAEIHTIMHDLAGEGTALLLASTDLDELVDVCDRVVVFSGGHVGAELAGPSLTSARLLEAMNAGAGRVAATG